MLSKTFKILLLEGAELSAHVTIPALTCFSRAQNVRCIHSSTNGIILDFEGVNLLEEYHGLMKSTDDSKSYLGISTSYSTKLLNETVTVNTID